MERMYEKVCESAKYIQENAAIQPKIGVILGSGLGDLVDLIEDKEDLTIAFLTEDILHSPGFQTFMNIDKLGNYNEMKNKKKERIVRFANGLIIKNYVTDSFNVSDSDAVFCIFDARENFNPKWNEVVSKIIQKLPKNKVILISIRVSKDADLSTFISQFNVNEQAEKRGH